MINRGPDSIVAICRGIVGGHIGRLTPGAGGGLVIVVNGKHSNESGYACDADPWTLKELPGLLEAIARDIRTFNKEGELWP